MDANETKQEEGYLLIPRAWMQDISERLSKMSSMLEKIGGYDSANCLGDYVSEDEAKRQLGKKTTWFWSMRTTGQLPFAKVGRRIFYLKSDIKKLLETSKKQNTPEYRTILSKVA